MKLKSILFFLKIVRMYLTGQTTPVTVIFNVTNRCNSRCKHCYAAYFDQTDKNEMSSEEAMSLLSDLRRNGCLRVSFSGGEPLLRSDIGRLIEHARSLGMSVTLNTNGILVPKYLEVLKNVDALAISLDGIPEHHDILRGEGTGKKALEGIKRACQAGIRVHVNMVINKFNANDIDYMLDLARQHGFKAEFALAISNLWGDGLSPEEFKPSNEDFRRCLRYIIEKKKAGERILFSAASYKSVLESWTDFSVEGIMDGSPPQGMPECPAGKFFCLIEADGTLCACPHLIGKIPAKNALKEGVAEAWRVAQKHPCVGCYQVYHHEFSKLMSLNKAVVWNYVKTAVGVN